MNGRGSAIFTVAFAVVLLALGAGYLVFRTYTPPTSAAPPITPEVRQFSLQLRAAEIGDAKLHNWIPATIVVHVGDTVILKVTNTDEETAHGFTLAAFSIVAPPIAAGETQTFRFRASRPGVFHFGCNVDSCSADHADQTGQLVVLGIP